MEETRFQYSASCTATGCEAAPRYKIAAPWSHGPIHELKCYGLSCEQHLESLRQRAESHRQALALRDDEQVGPVEVFPMNPERSTEL